jgi:hypothetical protein
MLGIALGLLVSSTIAQAQNNLGVGDVIIAEADPRERGDGTMGPAAAAALRYGPLPMNAAHVAAKREANRARLDALRSGLLRRATPSELVAAGGAAPTPKAPVIVSGHNFAGQSGLTGSPPDTTGAIGPSRYIQLVNNQVAIYNRNTHAVIGSGSLNELAKVGAGVNSFDPQIIWDPTTKRFYYVMDSIFSATDNRLSWGFSKSATPNNVTSAWCHYTLKYGTPFPDYPKLGDSKFFIIIGVNTFVNDSFIGSDIIGISKPPAGTTCPKANTFLRRIKKDLRDASNIQVFTPVPANQIDTFHTGYVVAREGLVTSTNLWFFNVVRDAATGKPNIGNARGVSVPAYSSPANADQPTFTQVLDTLDARPTQAVQAINPGRSNNPFSFWTQHTIASGSVSAVRWYEINPKPATPVLLRSGTISASNTFFFNAAISPDRRVDGATKTFGQSFVINYNASSDTNDIDPRILAASSVNGGAVATKLIRNGVGPYRDFTCPNAGNVCRWGDYSGATPDPKPATAGRGVVWGTNQFSGVNNPPANGVNWRTRIFAVRP